MGSDSESLTGKVQDKIGSLMGGNKNKKVSRVDEDPDIEYPEPLDKEIFDDGRVVLTKNEGQEEDQSDAAPDGGTDDTTDAGSPPD